MKGMKCTQVRLVNTVSEGTRFLCIQLSVTGACFLFLFFVFVFLSTASVVVLSCCRCIALLVVNGTRWQVGGDDYRRRT